MNREEVTDLIVTQKVKKKLTWAQLAEVVGHSKEWSTAALLGQMTLTEAQAKAVGPALEGHRLRCPRRRPHREPIGGVAVEAHVPRRARRRAPCRKCDWSPS